MTGFDSTPDGVPREDHRATRGSAPASATALFWRLLPGLVIAVALSVAGARWIASNWDAETARARFEALRALLAGAPAEPVSSPPSSAAAILVEDDARATHTADAIDPVALAAPGNPHPLDKAATALVDGQPAAPIPVAAQPPSPVPVGPPDPRAARSVSPRDQPPSPAPETPRRADGPLVDPGGSAARRAAIAAELARKLGPPVRPIGGAQRSTPAVQVPPAIREGHQLLDAFAARYAAGDLAGLMDLFSADANAGSGGIAAVRADYHRLFASTVLRSLRFGRVHWKVRDGTLLADLPYTVELVPAGIAEPSAIAGRLRLSLQRQAGAIRITRIRQDEGSAETVGDPG